MSTAARLDVRGLLCPVPVLRARRLAAGMSPGELLEVLGDDPLLRIDVLAWCARDGHDVLAVEENGGELRCLLRVGGGGTGGE